MRSESESVRMNFNVIPARYVLAIMGLFGTFTTILLKVNLNIAIVAMVDFDALEPNLTNQYEDDNWNLTTQTPQHERSEFSCLGTGQSNDHLNKTILLNEKKFLWTAGQQGLVLGCFSYGSAVTQIGMAHLNRRFGHVRVIGITVLGSSILTLLNPIVAESMGYVGYVILRILIGILSGATPAQIMGLAGIWSPPQERSRILSIIFAGLPLGLSCVMPVAGMLAANLGWKYVFYVTGACGMCWAILWILLIHETPDDHPRISSSEKEFINSSLQKSSCEDRVKHKIPWLKILKSGAVICVVIVHFCSIFGRFAITTMFPTYLKTVQKVDVEMSGFLSAIPFAVNGLLVFLTGAIADLIISRGFKASIVRKAFTGSGMLISAATIVSLGYAGCNVPVAVTMATAVIAMDAFAVSGFKASILDIAPELSGVVFSLSTTAGAFAGILSPQAIGSLRQAYGFLGWKITFWIAAGLYVFGAGVFTVFGTNKKQSWSTPKNTRPFVTTITETLE